MPHAKLIMAGITLFAALYRGLISKKHDSKTLLKDVTLLGSVFIIISLF